MKTEKEIKQRMKLRKSMWKKEAEDNVLKSIYFWVWTELEWILTK